MRKVSIVGLGWTPPRPLTPEQSYREMIYEAATKAYHDAGLSPKDVDGFVTCAEDLIEGTSIFDEYTPDQLGAAQRPVHTITGDGLHGLIAAYLKIQTGLMDVVLIETHSKASNILTLPHILHYAIDPIYNRPLNFHPYAVAGLEMHYFLEQTKTPREATAAVAVKNKRNALTNSRGCYGGHFTQADIVGSESFFEPLTKLETSLHADGAFIVILAAEDKLTGRAPVRISGVGWTNDSPTLETRSWDHPLYVTRSARSAYKLAGIKKPLKEIDFSEVDDTFAYKELQHLESLGIFAEGKAGKATLDGKTSRDGIHPVNPSGGSLGVGSLLDANGLYRTIEATLQIRGEAGSHQLSKARRGLVQSWRGIPSASGAVVILEKGKKGGRR